MDWVVEPVDHVLFGSDEVKVTLAPSQIVVDPEAEIFGIEDTGITVTVIGELVLVQPFTFV
jgi:hypothetical protein